MYSAAFVWAKVIQRLEVQLGSVMTSTWLDDAEPVEVNDKRFVLYSPSDFRQETIRRSCRQHIEDALREILKADLELVVWGESQLKSYRNEKSAKKLWTLNPLFSFENFIAGSSNLIPLKAARHVAENPGDDVYNPLYLYGPPGVGKTHLLYAIANYISRHFPGKQVVYVKGEQFTNELVQAILNGNTLTFKKKYREADVLLVDDIQFIAGKDATQEEFFHTFNEIYDRGGQIVITSDRKPGDMATLEDRLRGRFGVGVMMEIMPPDAQTRSLIVRDKAGKLGLALDEASVELISGKLCDNVRQIEGGLRKLRAYRDLSGMALTRENIAQTIADVQSTESAAVVTPELVVRYVCRYYGIEEVQLKSQNRSKNIAEPRQVAMYLTRTMLKMSLPDIGRFFERDHGTVSHSVKKVEAALKQKDSRLEGVIRDIQMSIRSHV